MKKAVVFDFDGVIVDSAHECWVVALKTFKQMGEHLEDTKENKKKYMILRSFLRLADDYYTIFKSIQQGIDVEKIDLSSFRKTREHYVNEGKDFHKLFYENRNTMKKENITIWLDLHTVYPWVVDSIKELMGKYLVFIATNKDKLSTIDLLNHFGVNIPEEDILTKEFFLRKEDKLQKISEKYDLDMENILFVEDNLENLIEVQNAIREIKLALVDWSYVPSSQHDDARKLGMVVLNQKNLTAQIEAILK